jgi:hypothetical protein
MGEYYKVYCTKTLIKKPEPRNTRVFKKPRRQPMVKDR